MIKLPRMDFVPLVRVGPFVFGEPASSAEALGFVLMEDECAVDVQAYGDVTDPCDSVRVYVEDGTITGIALYDSLFYANVNLIGASLVEAVAAMGGRPSSSDTAILSDGEQTIYYWDDHWLTLWFKAGRVVTAQCNEEVEEEEGSIN